MNLKKVAIILVLVISILLNGLLWAAYDMERTKTVGLVGILDKEVESYNAQLAVGKKAGDMADACLSATKGYDYVGEYEKLKVLAKERDRLFDEYQALKKNLVDQYE